MDDLLDAGLWRWANSTADSSCDAACRVQSGLRDRGTWWQGLERAAEQVCWGCDQEPWPNERGFGHEIYGLLHAADLPIRSLAGHTNLWSVPCPRGIQRRTRGTRCLIGHFVYGIMCFFKWMGEAGHEDFALTNLESVIDLAPMVSIAPCRQDWAFPVAEVSENYERILDLVWHRHERIPDRWLPASGPLRCERERAREAQETATQPLYKKIQCAVLVIYPQEISRMSMIAETYADHCDSLMFFTCGSAPDYFKGYRVVNLQDAFDIASDSQGTPNTIAKTFGVFHYLGLALMHPTDPLKRPDVICRLDSDTLLLARESETHFELSQLLLPTPLGHWSLELCT